MRRNASTGPRGAAAASKNGHHLSDDTPLKPLLNSFFLLSLRRLFISRAMIFAIACWFYMTVSGHIDISKQETTITTTTGREETNFNHHDVNPRTSRLMPTTTNPSSPSSLNDVNNNNNNVVTFPGYPLTKESIMAVGTQLGGHHQSVVSIFKRKQQAANNDDHYWCHVMESTTKTSQQPHMDPSNNNNTKGLFFVKTPKTASQTVNRILKRISNSNGGCFLRGHHIQADPGKWYRNRHPTYSVLLTSLRDPAPRALSRIYWTLSTRQYKGGITPQILSKALTSWTDVETGCVSEGQGGFQLQYVSFDSTPKNSAWTPEQPTRVQNPPAIHQRVQNVLEKYDFILVQERLEESLVALQLLLGVPARDMLSMPLHVGGSYLYDRHAGCLPLMSSSDDNNNNVANFLQTYFESPTWLAQNYGDYVLWSAAQASLNHTIQELGVHKFETALADFRRYQATVLQVCSQEVVFPCSANGTIQREDYQLGHPRSSGDRYPQKDIEACIDRVVVQLQQQQQQQQQSNQ